MIRKGQGIFLVDESEGYVAKSFAAFVLRKIGGKRPVQLPRRLVRAQCKPSYAFADLKMPPLSVGVYSPSMVHILLKMTSCRFPRAVAFKIRKHHGGLQTLTGGFAVAAMRLQSH